jgi:hypothetical protein
MRLRSIRPSEVPCPRGTPYRPITRARVYQTGAGAPHSRAGAGTAGVWYRSPVVRLAWLVAMEVTVVGGLGLGAAWGACALVTGGRARAVAVRPAPAPPATRPAAPVGGPLRAPQPGSDLREIAEILPNPAKEGTFDGANDELLLERIRTGRIASIKFNRGGSSISLRLTFADGSRAACKPDQTNLQSVPRKEIAAYRINRLLGLTGVPPAAARVISRDEIERLLVKESRDLLARIRAEVIFDREGRTGAAVSHWIPEIRDARLEKDHIPEWEPWLRQGGTPSPRGEDFVRQLSGLLVLDVLTSNYDRFTGTNDLMSPDGRTLYSMDNTIGFYLEPEGHPRPREHLIRAQRFSRHLYERLRAFDEAALRAELAREPAPPWAILTDQELQAVLQRRDFALAHIERLIAAHGRAKVLCFP